MKINQIKVKHVLFLGYTGWCGLGFCRGMNSYKFEYFYYKKNNENNLIYTNQFLHGTIGTFFYAVPFFFPFFLYKEIYRLEVNIRNLEYEKKSRFYNELI
jgi:hypothetical protein